MESTHGFLKDFILNNFNDVNNLTCIMTNSYDNALKDYLNAGLPLATNDDFDKEFLSPDIGLVPFLETIKKISVDSSLIKKVTDKITQINNQYEKKFQDESKKCFSLNDSEVILSQIQEIFDNNQIDNSIFHGIKNRASLNPIEYILIELMLEKFKHLNNKNDNNNNKDICNRTDFKMAKFLSTKLYNSMEKNTYIHGLYLFFNGNFNDYKLYDCLYSILNRTFLTSVDTIQLHRILFTDKSFCPSNLQNMSKLIDCFLDELYINDRLNSSNLREKKIDILSLLILCSTVELKNDLNLKELINVKNSCVHRDITTSIQIISNRDWKSISVINSNVYNDLANLLATFENYHVSIGLLKYIKQQILQFDNNVQFSNDLPLPLLMLTDLVDYHPFLFGQVFNIIKELLHHQYSAIDSLIEYQLKQILINQMIHLLTIGNCTEIIDYMKECLVTSSIDVSLIRQFCSKVLNSISPPYSSIFGEKMRGIIMENSIISGIHNNKDRLIFENFLSETNNSNNIKKIH